MDSDPYRAAVSGMNAWTKRSLELTADSITRFSEKIARKMRASIRNDSTLQQSRPDFRACCCNDRWILIALAIAPALTKKQ